MNLKRRCKRSRYRVNHQKTLVWTITTRPVVAYPSRTLSTTWAAPCSAAMAHSANRAETRSSRTHTSCHKTCQKTKQTSPRIEAILIRCHNRIRFRWRTCSDPRHLGALAQSVLLEGQITVGSKGKRRPGLTMHSRRYNSHRKDRPSPGAHPSAWCTRHRTRG